MTFFFLYSYLLYDFFAIHRMRQVLPMDHSAVSCKKGFFPEVFPMYKYIYVCDTSSTRTRRGESCLGGYTIRHFSSKEFACAGAPAGPVRACFVRGCCTERQKTFSSQRLQCLATNLLHYGPQNKIQKTSRNREAMKGPRLYKQQVGTDREKKACVEPTLMLMLERRKICLFK